MNRIFDLRLRKKRGEALVEKINWWLDQGFPAWEFSERGLIKMKEAQRDPLADTKITEGVQMIIDLKVRSLRDDSARSYKSIGGLFIQFLEKKRWGDLRMDEFSKRHAVAYMVYVSLI